MGKDFGWDCEAAILALHRRGPNQASVAHVAEAAPTETEKQLRKLHGESCGNCMGRTTSCPENNPDCRFNPARTVQEVIGNVEAYRQWVRDHNGL
jgi:heterodisulfide reductase subunit C